MEGLDGQLTVSIIESYVIPHTQGASAVILEVALSEKHQENTK